MKKSKFEDVRKDLKKTRAELRELKERLVKQAEDLLVLKTKCIYLLRQETE